MTKHVEITVDRSNHSGHLQLAISEIDDEGGGSGYRIAGPKFCACHDSERLLTTRLDQRDIIEIRRHLDRSDGLLDRMAAALYDAARPDEPPWCDVVLRGDDTVDYYRREAAAVIEGG